MDLTIELILELVACRMCISSHDIYEVVVTFVAFMIVNQLPEMYFAVANDEAKKEFEAHEGALVACRNFIDYNKPNCEQANNPVAQDDQESSSKGVQFTIQDAQGVSEVEANTNDLVPEKNLPTMQKVRGQLWWLKIFWFVDYTLQILFDTVYFYFLPYLFFIYEYAYLLIYRKEKDFKPVEDMAVEK